MYLYLYDYRGGKCINKAILMNYVHPNIKGKKQNNELLKSKFRTLKTTKTFSTVNCDIVLAVSDFGALNFNFDYHSILPEDKDTSIWVRSKEDILVIS